MVAQAGEGQEKHPGLSRRTRQKTLILSSLESLGKRQPRHRRRDLGQSEKKRHSGGKIHRIPLPRTAGRERGAAKVFSFGGFLGLLPVHQRTSSST